MNNPIEQYIREVISSLTCSPQEKQEIADEMRDHLYTSYGMLIEEGYEDEEAMKKTISSFGESDEMKVGFQQVVDPLYGWLRKLAWGGFVLYSFVVSWKLIIERMIRRIDHYHNWGDYSPYVYSERYLTGEKGFFDFSAWEMNINFVPFKTIFFYAKAEHVNPEIAVNNLMGNLLLLLPLGLLLPFLFKRCQKLTSIATIAFVTSVGIEAIQFILQIGTADIDDIILNTMGAVVGFYGYRFIIW